MHISYISNRQHRVVIAVGGSARSVILTIIMLASAILRVNAQTGQTLYFMETLPQSALLNPAYQHSHNFHIGLPMLSSFNLNAKTNFVTFSDLVFKHPQYDSLISFLHPDANLSDFTGKLKERNNIAPDLHLNILSFGFRMNGSFITFSVSERASFRATLPRDFILLGLEGNEQFTDRKADFSSFGADLNYFREYAAGYSRQVDERLTIGGRLKLLFGKANISFAGSDISLYNDPESYNTMLHSSLKMNMSMPVTLVKNENGDIDSMLFHFDRDDYNPMEFIFNPRNTGFAVDLGATFRLIEPLALYASVTDLGFINWKKDIYNLSMDGDFEFEGFDLSPLFDYSDDSDPEDNLLDSLKGLFRITDTRDVYRRQLPARIYLGGTYEVRPGMNLGLLSRSEIYQGGIEQAFTLSANAVLRRWLSASLSYSVMNNSYSNVGMGLALRGGGFQIYMLSDNLGTLFMPHRTKNANLWFGLNLVFGRRGERQIGAHEFRDSGVPLNAPGRP